MSDSEKKNMEKVKGRRNGGWRIVTERGKMGTRTLPAEVTVMTKIDGRQYESPHLHLSWLIFSSFHFVTSSVLKETRNRVDFL